MMLRVGLDAHRLRQAKWTHIYITISDIYIIELLMPISDGEFFSKYFLSLFSRSIYTKEHFKIGGG